jgi:hypothetical protein
VGAALLTAASAYVHYSGLLMAAVIAATVSAVAIFGARRELGRLLAAAGLAILLYLPWAPSLFEDLEKGGPGFLKPPEVSDLLQFAEVGLPVYVYLACGMLAAAGHGLPPREPRDRVDRRLPLDPTAFLTACLLGFVGGVWLKSVLGEPIFNSRSLTPAWPLVFVLLGAAATRAATGRRRQVVAGVALATVATVVALENAYIAGYYEKQTKRHWRQATELGLEWVGSRRDVRVISIAHGGSGRFNYYLGQLGSHHRVKTNSRDPQAVLEAVGECFQDGSAQVLVLSAHANPRRVLAKLKRNYTFVRHEKLLSATATLIGKKRPRRVERHRRE